VEGRKLSKDRSYHQRPGALVAGAAGKKGFLGKKDIQARNEPS
jgi:hypothetical protein